MECVRSFEASVGGSGIRPTDPSVMEGNGEFMTLTGFSLALYCVISIPAAAARRSSVRLSGEGPSELAFA